MRTWQTITRRISASNAPRARSYSCSRALCRQSSIAELLQQKVVGEEIHVNGWVRSVRKQKRVAFAAIGDGSTIEPLQAVFLRPDQVTGLSHGTGVRLTGCWETSPGSGQKYELKVANVQILGDNDAENNPLQPKYQTAEYLRTMPHLRARTTANALLLRLRSQVIATLTSFFAREGFVQTHPAIITSSDCEGAGEVFVVSSKASNASKGEAPAEHFFRSEKYLTVSSQLHLEALALAVNRVWTLSPTFRAERSDTPRHLAEFYMLEAEMCFVDDVADVMDLVERMLHSVAGDLLSSRLGEELLRLKTTTAQDSVDDGEKVIDGETLQARWTGMASDAWPRITYNQAIDCLKRAASQGQARFVFAPCHEAGLHAEHERYLAESIGRGQPVFVTDYPAAQKPFYMSPSTPTGKGGEKQDSVACFDLLVPELCELAGGSLREHRLEPLLHSMREKGLGDSSLEWYKDLRRYGSVPHGGFGLGFDRLLCYLGGLNSIRDSVTFPRWAGRCDG